MRYAVFFLGSGLLSVLSCSPASTAPPPAAPTSVSPTEPTEAATSESVEPQRPSPDVLYEAPSAVPSAPESCPAKSPLPPRESCATPRDRLAESLTAPSTDRDAALARLEACDAFPTGLVRALRIELGEAECGDALAELVVGESAPEVQLRPEIRETLVALGLGARLRRLAQVPPQAPESRKKDDLNEYFRSVLFPWIENQATAIFAMASQGKELSGYARGIVAIEAGNVDMRFVEIARAVPVSEDIAQYEEAQDVYYAALDEQLEPRKARGRNAALVGLREMAQAGVIRSPRIASARSLLSRAYGGRRIDALDTLLVPELPEQSDEGPSATIASHVPSPYSAVLLAKEPVSPELVRAHLEMGMPSGLRNAITTEPVGGLPRLLLARALFESGRTFFRAQDFQDATSLLSELLDGETSLSPDDRERATLLRALSVALMAGPKDAAEMIAQGPRFLESLGNLAILDGLSDRPGQMGGRATFDAAYLRELVVPPADPKSWKNLARRYDESARKLQGPEARTARDRARACREIEKTVREQIATSDKARSDEN